MTNRSFVVFQDTPSSSDTVASAAPKPVARAASNVLVTRSGTSTNISTLSDLGTAIDKENYHPVTGERATSNASNAEKKRKTAVLATKLHVPASTKKQKSGQPEAKKRKTLAAGSSKSKSSSTKKDGKSSGAGKKAKRTSPRRAPPLPKVEEENGYETEKECDRLTQAAIDSRCYELTVKPLADVSAAYEASGSSESICDDKDPFRTVKESSVEPDIRDYFSPTHSVSSFSSARFGHLVEEEDAPGHTFSTPERKKIYASFTFSSPSPSSKRFREASSRPRTASPPPPMASAAETAAAVLSPTALTPPADRTS